MASFALMAKEGEANTLQIKPHKTRVLVDRPVVAPRPHSTFTCENHLLEHIERFMETVK
jgi:hypothetical protein